MKCDSIREKLGPYVDGELDGADVADVDGHVAYCSDCSVELETLRKIANALGPGEEPVVPKTLWPSIDKRLSNPARTNVRRSPSVDQPRTLRILRPPWAIAAAIALAVGLGFLGVSLTGSKVEAANVDFSMLLDSLELNPRQAFQKFLDAYSAKLGTADQAKRYASNLSFDLPSHLPHGFRLDKVYLLTFGDAPGVAASYHRGDEFLAAIFHPPVRAESYGTHEDYECVVGQHRGHKVQVGEWKLVHLTDPSTCHCLLSKLDEHHSLPAIMDAVAPSLGIMESAHEHD